ncbi:MAG: ABC transporter ATP-binding protein [Candidatus Tenebribacter davisii]|nr:ABC transporter ATP-binding protein [Candidatus Tenebribacter davisii]
MRHGATGFNEDDIKAKIYDGQMMKKLIKYLLPYKFYVVISFIMLILIAASELAIPAITKIAIDEHITSNKDLIEFNSKNEQQHFIEKYNKAKFKEYDYNDKYFLLIPDNKLNFLTKEEKSQLIEEDILFTKVTLINNKAENLELLQNITVKTISADFLAVGSADLFRLKKEGALDKEQLRGIQNYNINKVKTIGIILFSIIVAQFFFYYLQIFMINFASQHAMYDLRRDVFAHVSKMPLSFFDKNPIGRLVTRVTNDVRTLDEMFSNGLIQLIQEFFVLGGIIIIMLIFNWKLALITFSVLPVVYILFRIFMKKSRIIYRDVRKKVAKINSTLAESISGIKIIQLFNQEERKKREFFKINNEYYERSLSQMKLFAFFRPLINSMRRVAVAILLWYGGSMILDNVITLGVFIAFISYMDRFFEPINRLSEKFNILQAAMAGTERIFDLMNDKPEDFRIENHQKNGETFRGEIEFKNLWLAYNDDDYVLKDISFKIKPGEKVALVGHTGSGKTSIINLIAGMYPFQKGNILIDGKDQKTFSLEEIRNNIGIVQQDVFLFSGTIKDNIVLNNKDISDEDIEQVAKYVNVHKFIDSLPGKFMEPVMERGSTLSVGQRQLIAFARVLAYDPTIFVLDEATANIDTETEILIQDALKKLMENRTSIIIAHRLSTIQHVDRIIVMHKGRIVEEGNHQELLAKEGLYYDLYRLQYK